MLYLKQALKHKKEKKESLVKKTTAKYTQV